MRKTHFFKANSRLGTINIPWRGKELNIGVENGPEAILSAEFLSCFSPTPKVTPYKFPNPEEISKENYQEVIAQTTRKFANIIGKYLAKGETQVVIGGDHSVSLSSVLALVERMGKDNLGFIQIDSHVDLLDFAHSVTGNFNGMFAKVLFADFDNKYINSIFKEKLPTSNVMYIGNLELDAIEKKFIEGHNIPNITRSDILHNIKLVIKELQHFISSFNHIHISFDIDVFDRSLVQATGTVSLSGLFEKDIFPLLNVLAGHPCISVDLAEVNPAKTSARKSIKIAREVLLSLLL